MRVRIFALVASFVERIFRWIRKLLLTHKAQSAQILARKNIKKYVYILSLYKTDFDVSKKGGNEAVIILRGKYFEKKFEN